MFLKRRTRLTREGWYFVFILALVLVRASMKDINLMLVFAGMMVGVLYFNWFALRMMLRRIAIRRRLPDSVTAGEMAVIELEATSSHRATAIEIEDAFQLAGSARPNDRGRGVAMFPQIVRGQAARTEYRVRFGRRGRYAFGTILATSRYPFRLFQRTISLRQPEQLVVLPRLGRLTSRWTNIPQAPEPGTRRVVQRQGLSEGDFYGMRDWRPGDSKRRIHWRTSARRGNLMVRQFEQPRSENLTLLVDLWQPEEPEPRDEDNVELAVSLAATIAVDVCRRGGSQLHVAVAGRELISLGGGASRALARDVLLRLAVAEAASHEQLGELIERGVSDGPSGRIVLVSTRPDGWRGEAEMAAANGGSNRLGTAVATSLQQAALARMLRIDVGSEELGTYFQID